MESAELSIVYVWDADYPWDVRTEKVCIALTAAGHTVTIVARNKAWSATTERLHEGTVRRMPPWRLLGRKLDNALGFPAFFNPRWIRLVDRTCNEVDADLIVIRDLPLCATAIAVDNAATAEIEWFKSVLTGIRKIRSEMNISPGKTIPLLLADGDASDRARITKFDAQISFLARVETPKWIAAGADEPAAAAAVVGTLRVMIPLAGLIDLGAEQARLAKEISRIEIEIKKCEGKLSNANFVANAPAEVVTQERQRITDWNITLDALREQSRKLQG